MANFVEFEYDGVRSINIDNIGCISLYLCDTAKSNISIAFNGDDVPFNICLNSKEEAQALYDLLRGNKPKDKLDQIREALKKTPTVAALQILNEIKDILDEGE